MFLGFVLGKHVLEIRKLAQRLKKVEKEGRKYGREGEGLE